MSIKLTVILFFSCMILFGQDRIDANVKVVENFSKDLFNEEVKPKDIVDMYMAFKKPENREISDAKNFATKFIQMTRDSVGKDMSWMLPDIKVKNLKNNRKVCLYQSIEDMCKLELNVRKDLFKNVYVLVNTDTNEIVQYFYVEEGKILFFNLFGKGDEYWFFTFN